ncbi:MAG TPA: FAD-binding oxidoreductase [Casimicrobiaceae bacterium]|nr:FAD-binding oxidoreductase [Casimicrobiaceae bacterium]
MTAEAPAVAPSRWQQAVIERIVPRTPRVISVFLKVPLDSYVAGQHVDVRLTAPDGYQAQRSYSIASAPGSADVELAIERLDDGEVSPFFHDVARAGDTIEVRGPIGGHFIWRPQDGGPILLIGGGSGVVPLMSILRAWSAAQPKTQVLLAYSARSWDELIFRDELLTLQAREPNFTFIAATTREPRHRPDDFDRRLDRSLVHQLLTRWTHTARAVYACGSNAFVEAVTSSLVLEAVPAETIRTERYGGAP